MGLRSRFGSTRILPTRPCSVSQASRCSAFSLRLLWQKRDPTTSLSIRERRRPVRRSGHMVESIINGVTDGFTRPVYLINGEHPAPLIEANEDDTLEVFVEDDLPVETTIHWHGILQRGTPHLDGVPGITQYPIAPGGNFTYRFDLSNEYGFYLYRSHFRAYYNDAIRGPLSIRPKRSRSRPFESIASSAAVAEASLQAERDAFPVLLTDWYHEVSDMVLREYNRTGVFPHCVNSLLANGLGRVQCLPQAVLNCGPSLCLGSDDSSSMSMESSDTTSTSMASSDTVLMSMAPSDTAELSSLSSAASMDMTLMDGMADESSKTDEMSMTMSALPSSTAHPMRQQKRQMMDMWSMDISLGPRGCMPPTMFRPGFNASDLPPETCTETMAPLLTISANSLQAGWPSNCECWFHHQVDGVVGLPYDVCICGGWTLCQNAIV